jgi:hypothetical protein
VWASISLCLCVCIECSGAHRALGVHISKVRSLTLDEWDPDTLEARPFSSAPGCCLTRAQLLSSVGSLRANRVWEAAVPPDRVKPAPTADRAVKSEWIQDKYVHHRFVGPWSDPLPPTEVRLGVCTHAHPLGLTRRTHQALRAGADDGDLLRMYAAVVHGAELSAAGPDGRTALHVVAARGDAKAVMLLLLNGAAVDVRDSVRGRLRIPAHCV